MELLYRIKTWGATEQYANLADRASYYMRSPWGKNCAWD